jgi:hypothetical protein
MTFLILSGETLLRAVLPQEICEVANLRKGEASAEPKW